jgi:hypothetical protein
MSYYFSQFPKVQYDPTGQNKPVLAIDLTRRFKLANITINNSLIYYDYDIKDRDRPDIMADKYYGDSTLDWLFFITNQIFDPYFQWPLNYKQFVDYITQKYGSVSVSQANIHHYEQILQARTQLTTEAGEETNFVPERTVVVDLATYNTLSSTARYARTNYDWEEAENNRKRTIKILDAAFLPEIMQQLVGIFEE